MSFDLSRVRFDARKDFFGLVMQQGRVQLDAEWNEWVAQLARRIQATSLDTFGGTVVPRTTPDGFRIDAVGGDLRIGLGRIYVDGLLAENHGGAPATWDPRLATPTGTTAPGYTEQPYYPSPPALPAGGPHLVYLDVWQRDVTAVEDPGLIEPAVGVDTTGRLQTVWQVKLLPDVGNSSCATPDADLPGWAAATAPSAGRLSNATGDPGGEPDPCRVPPAAGYRGLENQLYRVQVHTGGPLGTATFKWSRDNATVASRASHVNAARDRVTVESIGRDDVLRFHDGDWVEVTDDHRELHGLAGVLRRIRVAGGVDETARSLTFDVALPAGMFPTDAQQATDPARHTRVRRWDQSGTVRREDGTAAANLNDAGSDGDIVIPADGTRLFLEHGILVAFSTTTPDGQFRSGDHWVFAARSADASIEPLAEAPPLGIHHHYARLAIVNFPDLETDCRSLWPPIADGEGCDCTVCVDAENHNNGTATIQQAIDSIKDGGGTICLGIGSYNLRAPLLIDGARSLRLRGQGWASVLLGEQTGSIIDIRNSTGVALENLSTIGSTGGGVSSVISARGVIDLRADHVNVLGLAAADGTSVGIGLSGNMLGVQINDCAIVAERGVASVAAGDDRHLLVGELRLARNLFFCSQRALSLDGITLHFGQTRVDANFLLTGSQAAVVATGAVMPGSAFVVADNTIYTAADGIRGGVDGLAVERNTISGFGERSGNGIVLEEGLDPVALDQVRLNDNRLHQLRGHGIFVGQRVDEAIICGNMMDGMGLGALVMGDGGAFGVLRLAGNQFRHLGQALTNDDAAFVAVQLVRVERGDVLDNLIADVARAALASPGIDAIRCAGVGQLRLAGNRLLGIGPDRISAPVCAVRVLAPFDRLALDDNSIERLGGTDQKPVVIEWRALRIGPDAADEAPGMVVTRHVAGADAAYVLTRNRITALPSPPGVVSVRGNQLRSHLSGAPLAQVDSVDHCLLADNHCEVVGAAGKEPVIGLLAARTINASNNRLAASQEQATLLLRPLLKRAIVMGNTSTGPIQVQGASVPSDINLTNIIGS